MYKERPEQIWIASIARKIVLVAGSILVFLLTTQQVHAEELELYRRQLKLPGGSPEGQQILPVESAKSDQLSTTRPGISFAGSITPVSQQKSPLLKETPIQTWEYLGKSILYAIAGDDIQSYFGFRPSISVVKSPLPMASIGESGRIIFSSGLLSMLSSQEEFAFVISHEIAHQLLGHHSETGHQWSLEEESKADQLALRLLEVGGYRSAGAISILEKLERFGADAGLALDALHPTLSARRLRLSELLISQATMGSPLHL